MDTPQDELRYARIPRRFQSKYLMFFFVALFACALFLIFLPQFFWVTLPFVFTYLVQAFDAL